ncbi:MAG: undecaprenyl/decaprenyl-phosphate alpha-N-acetylglucosaminyl 1-phosphate transferase [Clostridia bacterium]|nr:undecaprenyl/decaprenyl-phosphate alpha-N-acetylglucosaminyl 1-phosphate transferase [Clostridia bacterium]
MSMIPGSYIMLAFMLAFFVAFAATPFVKRLAYKIGAVDVPKDSRRMHKTPKARLGGLAIFLGFVVSVCIFCGMPDSSYALPQTLIGILLGALIIVILGMFDDVLALGPHLKFIIQTIAAICPVLFGVVIERISVPLFISETGVLELGWLGYPLTVIWIVAVTNAFNLIDGLDGLAVGVASISSLTLMCISLMLGNEYTAILTSALSGACLGFFPYNFNPAKLFMGDTGALFLGYTLSTVSILGLFKGYTIISVAIPILIVALPIFDTSAAIFRRLKNHRPIMSPDRGHLHHKLIDKGFTQKQAVGIIYALCAVLCLFAVFLLATGGVKIIVVLLIAVIFVVSMVVAPHLLHSTTTPTEDENKTEKHDK